MLSRALPTRIQAQIACAVADLTSPDEYVRGEAVRRLCPCRTGRRWTLDRYVVPMLHDDSPVVRYMADFAVSEELEHETRGYDSAQTCERDAGGGRRHPRADAARP